MISLSICNFFKFFIYHPKSEYLSDKDQKIALVARKIFNILSLTLIPKLCKKYWSNRNVWSLREKTILCRSIRTVIQVASIQQLSPREERLRLIEARKTPCHNILHGLYLGNVQAFMEATHLTVPLNSWDSVSIQNTNHERFNSVLTYCPMDIICDEYTQLDEDAIAPSFANHQVKWLFYGKTAIDSRYGWPGIVHDSTFPSSELAMRDIEFKYYDVEKKMKIEGQETKKLDKLMNDKKNALKAIRTSQWFEQAFNEIDKAVFHNKRVLVHCQKGYSRSATILAAYLINRFNVTSDEALNFLKSKRFCVDSKFTKELRSYQEALVDGR